MDRTFLRFHNHSVHSSRDGLLQIKDMVKYAVAQKEAFALTDHGSISGFIECIEECKKAKLKPVLGCEFYINNHRDRLIELKAVKGDKSVTAERELFKKNMHIVIIAKNIQGYENIITLNNIGYVHGFYGKPLITMDEIFSLAGNDGGGMIISSACMNGIVGSYIQNNDLASAVEVIKEFKSKFRDDFYLEVQTNNMDAQRVHNKILLKLAKKFHINVCIGSDSHYLEKKTADTHQDLLLLQNKQTRSDLEKTDIKITYETKKGEIKTKKLSPEKLFKKIPASEIEVGMKFGHDIVTAVEETNRAWKFSTDQLYYKSEQNIREEVELYHTELSADIDSIIENNYSIFNKVDLFEIDRSVKLPVIPNAKKLLVELVKKGLKAKGLTERKYIDRVKFELGVIGRNGFETYFLILKDFLDHATEIGLPRGTGRGSAVGSLVAYVLDIHRVNPMDERWGIDGLPFERFLSNERGIKKVILKGNGEQYEMLETDSARIIRDGEEIEIKAIDIMQGDEFIEKIK